MMEHHTHEKKPNQPKEIPIVQDDSEETSKAMQEIFDEEKVVHKHGGSQPEGD